MAGNLSETLTRQPGSMGRISTQETVTTVPENDQVTPEQAAEEARQAAEAAEARAKAAEARETTITRERDEAQARERMANAGALTAQEQAIETALAAQNAVVEQSKAALANAQATGDNAAVVDAIDKLTQARASILQLNQNKQFFADQKQRQEQQPQPQRAQGSRVTTPGGVLEVAPSAKQWMDDHPRFYSDPAYYNHAVAAHSTITADGVQEGTPAYFRALSDRMTQYERFEQFEKNGGEQVHQQQNQPASPRSRPPASSSAAPVSRGSTSYTAPSNGQIDPLAVARRIGDGVTVDDLRSFARDSGYSRQRGFESDEAGFQAYLREQEEIYRLQRSGNNAGLVFGDAVYR